MNRRTFSYTGALAIAGASIATGFAQSTTAGAGQIGRMDADEFGKANKAAKAKVKDLKPTAGTLSKGDMKLMAQIAAGGMMQLEASRIAAQKSTSKDVKMIAEAEVEEQMGLSEKLKEFAAAKQASLPMEADRKTTKLAEKLQGLSGAELDREYLSESGVKGHETLQETMTKVQSKADDADLKLLAMTALPLIQTHLQVSRDELATLS